MEEYYTYTIPSLKDYYVTIPVAGHAYLTVKAESEEDAIDKGIEAVTIDNVETWEPLERFNHGNFCLCPRPWNARAELVDVDEPVEYIDDSDQD